MPGVKGMKRRPTTVFGLASRVKPVRPGVYRVIHSPTEGTVYAGYDVALDVWGPSGTSPKAAEDRLAETVEYLRSTPTPLLRPFAHSKPVSWCGLASDPALDEPQGAAA